MVEFNTDGWKGRTVSFTVPVSVEEGVHDGDHPDRVEKIHGFATAQEATAAS